MAAIASTMVQTKYLVYMLTIVFIQFFVFVIMFEFIRKPWEGVETKAQEAENLENEKLFDDVEISRYATSEFTGTDLLQGYSTTLGVRKQQDRITADEKLTALKAAYDDPFVEIFNMIKIEEDADRRKYVAPKIHERTNDPQDGGQPGADPSAQYSTDLQTPAEEQQALDGIRERIGPLDLTRIEEEKEHN